MRVILRNPNLCPPAFIGNSSIFPAFFLHNSSFFADKKAGRRGPA
ncbi:hypothetical protein AB28_0139 [Raoultella ornithinolytica 2-156-04_S1_C2]|nr:hypothetical protein AB00_0138 [Raoultella ornithinolytica 2-156-04_S1_C1]KDX16599.1 hypothetical protein AB28_0139 [Raoultella ornithinolytica 2-156-04_S1_C2]